jgi:acetoacetate decarboxylase
MDEASLRKGAFAMPLSSRSYPPGPYRFIEQEYMIISYRTDFVTVGSWNRSAGFAPREAGCAVLFS